jgi:hypothetical protein
MNRGMGWGSYRWGPPGNVGAGATAHARWMRGRRLRALGGAAGARSPAGRPKAGKGEGCRVGLRGGNAGPREGGGQAACQATARRRKRGKEGFGVSSYFPLLIYFLICALALVLHRNACFTNSLNK